MTIIDRILAILAGPSNSTSIEDALLAAALLFEKQRGQQPCAWPDEIIQSNPTAEEMNQLREAVVAFVENNGIGSWTLGKCRDPSLKSVFVNVLRRHLHGDADELFQAMIALDRINERIFQNQTSHSIRDEEHNRELARQYLEQL